MWWNIIITIQIYFLLHRLMINRAQYCPSHNCYREEYLQFHSNQVILPFCPHPEAYPGSVTQVWWSVIFNKNSMRSFVITVLMYFDWPLATPLPIHSLVRICSSIMFDSEDFHILATWLDLKTWRCNTERHGWEWCKIDDFPFFCIFLAKHRFPYFLEIFSKIYLKDKRTR